MTVCKVLLYGLKPCDISSHTNDKISDISHQRQHSIISTTPPKLQSEKSLSPDTDYLNIDIKPVLAPTNARSSTSSDTVHESSPIRVIMRETPRGRYRICVSQTLLRSHIGDVS
ncbi:unnamed protein product [Adineta steineri]|uniref:Uncharacterized protein n=1 Tax=Adineta steineri TaxID=433720 RepID=A0A819J036_9BILA|nr:unnamed protein product [Adineta steineri]CAF0987246.1 unnamed protein product [Adineta steineri]CAF3723108.1 unnamed protein product [Adineta steineri]CAF3925545.1 unnamed protein product [Adineta steineri]